MQTKDLKDFITPGKRLHFIGIGGCGMSAIAKVLLALGYTVSGSDLKESANTMRLKEMGAKVFIGHEALNVRDAQVIVFSSAVKPDNPEMAEAVLNKLPILGRAQVLGYLMSLYQNSIAVAGTHGKTTTSSMLAVLLAYTGLDPTYMIGGEVTNLQSNGNYGSSSYFVAEADESDSSITYLDPKIFILNNIEKDHMDHFNSLEEIIDLFESCVDKLLLQKDHLFIINGEQWGNKMLLERLKQRVGLSLITFGFSAEMSVRAVNIRYKGQGSAYTLVQDGAVLGEIELSIPGEHNVLNSLAVVTAGLHLGLDLLKIKMALRTFTGAKRRFTLIGKYKGISIYDDYAHHPTEIRATLEAARKVYPQSRLVCAFQPHRYSRTMCFLNDFAQSLSIADKVIITSIYGAGEKPIPEVNAEMIAKLMPPDKVVYIDKKDDIADYLEKELKDGDVFFTLGAGDIYTVSKELLNRLKSRKVRAKNHAEKIVRIA